MDAIQERLQQANSSWPYGSYFSGDKASVVLAVRLARVVGDDPIEHALVWVDGGRAGQRKSFRATLFTANAVISGSIDAAALDTHPHLADVQIAPRSSIRTLVLHDVYDYVNPQSGTALSFTAAYDGLGEVSVRHQDHEVQRSGGTDALFSALQQDLLNFSVTASSGR